MKISQWLITVMRSLNWTEGSIQRNGGSLRQWSNWVKEGMVKSIIPNPPGCSK